MLLVEDDPELARLVELALEELDAELAVATSAEQAFEDCARTPFDLLLIDCGLPGVSGLELGRALLQDRAEPAPALVYITASTDPGLEARCWEAGAVDFVPKPLQLHTLARRVGAHLRLKIQTDLLRELAFKDPLTQLPNRRYLFERIESELGRSRRLDAPLSLLMIDIDRFKAYNDHYGHVAGDECLQRIAAALRAAALRPSDLVARIGGEEFAALLPDTPAGNARTVGERMRQAVLGLDLPHAPGCGLDRVSVSIGIATVDLGRGEDLRGWINRTDACLYRAKELGRNRVCVAPA